VTEPQFIGFAGRMGAGKTSAAKYLSIKYGLQYARYSEVLQEWLACDESDKDQLQRVGWNVMGGGMQRELNVRLIARLNRTQGAAIDGLRHPIDFESLSSRLGESFHLIFLETAPEWRFERLRQRFSTYKAFQLAELQPVEAFIEDLKPWSSTVILNEGPLEHLYSALEAWMTAASAGEQK